MFNIVIMKLILFYYIILVLPIVVQGQVGGTDNSVNKLAISQGIASPVLDSTTLFSNGYTMENPVAASYQDGYRMTGAVDGTSSTSFGADFGVGDTQYGIALGLYSNSCEEGRDCDAFVRGTMSAIWGGFGLGFGVQQDRYSMGLLFNPNGQHRVGIVVEDEKRNGSDNAGVPYGRGAFGLGYAFVMPQFSFALDISSHNYANTNKIDDAIMLSPGIAIRVDIFSVSMNYDYYLSNTSNIFSNKFWFGLSAQVSSRFQIKFYGEYVDRWTIAMTYNF